VDGFQLKLQSSLARLASCLLKRIVCVQLDGQTAWRPVYKTLPLRFGSLYERLLRFPLPIFPVTSMSSVGLPESRHQALVAPWDATFTIDCRCKQMQSDEILAADRSTY
jgi:hypothetical protein